eukprot:CAMPEP_0117047642 /NCGR_PEP_ID=MMETSP0472-20121206/32921_1 /TAXON_ID=693140 ORGANISM="Tiarina fusus, Strain LIS" /NCGR_SAMPLE_ID=MMETSP0472 /ASSEMBLY_ACC=CAM_ASM_000603 /LENGTH=298 /DNA_ID=CAMNT_0004760413 /DNA_START=177 /DNA_END=1070 /DNA_ORIENTATION=-
MAIEVLTDNGSESFAEFLKCNKKAQDRIATQKQQTKMKLLKEVFTLMKQLTAIGKKNEHTFECITLYIEILKEIQPSTDGWTWTQWWYSTQNVTLIDIKEAIALRNNEEKDSTNLQTLLDIIEEILEEQKAHAATESSWSLYRSSAASDVDIVKTKLNDLLDKSGFEICKKLETTIRDLDDDPSQFIEDHCSALLGCDISEEEKGRVQEFAEAFALNDWVLVTEESSPEDDVDYITWTLRKIKDSCTLYGYNDSVDHVLNTAGEYKSTCSRVKKTIEWVYFGGRLAVDPAGAMLSLLW